MKPNTPDPPSPITLREVRDADLPVLFEHQLDHEANWMAAFVSKDPTDRDAFLLHYKKILADGANTMKVIVAEGRVVGSIGSYEEAGEREVTYWIGKPYWGRGFATRALERYLADDARRPLRARCAKDNVASLRVLEKCGFVVTGEDRGFANARGGEIDELVLHLRELR